jgi:hypothetical protein
LKERTNVSLSTSLILLVATTILDQRTSRASCVLGDALENI